MVLSLPQALKEGMLKSATALGKYFTPEGKAKSKCKAIRTDDKLVIHPFFKGKDGGVPTTKFVNENGVWKVAL